MVSNHKRKLKIFSSLNKVKSVSEIFCGLISTLFWLSLRMDYHDDMTRSLLLLRKWEIYFQAISLPSLDSTHISLYYFSIRALEKWKWTSLNVLTSPIFSDIVRPKQNVGIYLYKANDKHHFLISADCRF